MRFQAPRTLLERLDPFLSRPAADVDALLAALRCEVEARCRPIQESLAQAAGQAAAGLPPRSPAWHLAELRGYESAFRRLTAAKRRFVLLAEHFAVFERLLQDGDARPIAAAALRLGALAMRAKAFPLEARAAQAGKRGRLTDAERSRRMKDGARRAMQRRWGERRPLWERWRTLAAEIWGADPRLSARAVAKSVADREGCRWWTVLRRIGDLNPKVLQ